MSRFNTGNPLGSGDPRDLDDNAKNMDLAVNSEDSQWVDRFGRPRLPLMEQERQFVAAQESRSDRFNDFIASSGYQFVGDYGPGIEITEYNQLIRDSNGEFWRVSGQVDLPYVTTGAGIPEDDALVPAGDAVLRQDLANPDIGAAMVARGVVAADSIADLLALPEGQRKEGLRYAVAGVGTYEWVSEWFGPADGGTVVPVSDGAYVLTEFGTTSAMQITVGAGGMFASIISALKLASTVRTVNNNNLGLINIHLLSGYVWDEQPFINCTDMSRVVITAEDPIVPVRREAMTVQQIPDSNRFAVLAAVDSRAPALACLLEIDDSGAPDDRIYGIQLRGSSMTVARGCGIMRAPGRGATVTFSSTLVAIGADFRFSGDIGIRTAHGSRTYGRESDTSGSRVGTATSQSIASYQFAVSNDCVTAAVSANGAAIVDSTGIVATGCCTEQVGDIGTILCSGGARVICPDSDLSGSLRRSIMCTGGGYVLADNANVSGSALHPIWARGGTVDAHGLTSNGAGNSILASESGEINTSHSTISCAVAHAVRVLTGGKIDVSDAVSIAATGNFSAIYAEDGNVTANRAKINEGTRSVIYAARSSVQAKGLIAEGTGQVVSAAYLVRGIESDIDLIGATFQGAKCNGAVIRGEDGTDIKAARINLDATQAASALHLLNGSKIGLTKASIANTITTSDLMIAEGASEITADSLDATDRAASRVGIRLRRASRLTLSNSDLTIAGVPSASDVIMSTGADGANLAQLSATLAGTNITVNTIGDGGLVLATT